MKRVFAFVLTMSLLFTGCGNQKPETDVSSEVVEQESVQEEDALRKTDYMRRV